MASTSRRAGTGFINLSDWANANAAGTQRLADELAGGVDSQGRAAQGDLDRLQRDFNERLEDGTLRYDPTGVDYGRADYLSREGYTGPNGLYESGLYNSAMGNAQTAGRNANLLNDFYGRQALLDDKAGGPGNYSTGQRLLDSALVGGAAGNRFADLKSQWGGLFDRAQGMERDAANAATEGRRVSDESARQYGALAPGLQRQENAAREQAERARMDSYYAAERENRARMAEEERRNRETNRTLDRREGLTPGRKAPRGGSAWDI